MERPVIAAIMVSYGSSRPARAAVQSLLDAQWPPDYIFVVNNGPARLDEWAGPARLEARDVRSGARPNEGITVIEAGRNRGYSGGVRLGVSALGTAAVDYVWLMNNDIVVHPRALSALVAAAADAPSVGLWGSTLCSDRSFATVSAVGARYSPWTTRRRSVLNGTPVSAAMDLDRGPRIDFVIGAAMFLPYSAYLACGGLSAAYFMYYEELDITARLRSVGFSAAWCRESLVAHRGGLTTGSEQERGTRPPAVAYHSMRSAILYTRRHRMRAVPTVVISRVLRHVCLEAVAGNVDAARAAACGCLAGLIADLGAERPR
jgi:GT2 family glycosyltransferase